MNKNSLVKAIFLAVCFCTSSQAFTQTPSSNPNAAYQPPYFADANRSQKIKTLFLSADKLTKDYKGKEEIIIKGTAQIRKKYI